MDRELQAQLAHLIALINTIDRKLDINQASVLALFNEQLIRIDSIDRKLEDMADQLSIEIIDND